MKKLLLLSPLLVLLAGCATVFRSTTQTIPVKSNVSDVNIEVLDSRGKVVFNGKTPARLRLKTSLGSFKGPETYTVRASKPGYTTQTYDLDYHISKWIFGSFFAAGLIGLGVDFFTGNVYYLDESVNIDMTK